MYTVKRIGVRSAIKVGAILSAMLVVVPVIIFLILNTLFKLWDIIIPPELLIQGLSSMAFWAAVWGGITAGMVAVIYNVGARFFGGLEVELKLPSAPRKRREQIDIE